VGAGGRAALVGRDVEVARLQELVRAVAGGRGGEVWVEGEAGIGKSAVLAAGLADAERLGCHVFRAAADELGGRLPLQVLLDCLRVGPESADPARREIAELLRDAREAPVAGTTPALVPALTDRLMVLVDRLCAQAPVVLAVDDLHWADADSLVLWRQWSRMITQLPLLLVAACRPVPRQAELEALRRASAAAGAAVVELPALSAEPAAALVGGLLGVQRVGPGLQAALEFAGGNPLYVREMVDALARERRLRVEAGAAELVDAGESPSVSLQAAISARLGFLSGPALEVWRAAALLGAEFAAGDLAAVARRPVAGLSAVVEEALAAGVLVESGPRLAFRHGLIRQVLNEGTPPASRVALHRQAARALADAGAAAEQVAAQLLAAMPEADEPGVVQGWELDWLAGRGRALAVRSPRVAAELLGRAVAHAPPGAARRRDLQAILVSVLLSLGRREEAAELAEHVRTATTDPIQAAEMSFTLARALSHLQRHEQARAALDDALRNPPDVIWTVRLRALSTLYAAQYEGDTDQEAAARDVLDEAERVGDARAAALAAQSIGISRYYGGDVSGALAVTERALARLGDDPHNADLLVLMLANRMHALEALDRLSDANVAVRDLVTAAERYAAPYRLATVRCTAAVLLYEVGRWDESLAELEAVADSTVPVAPLHRLLLHGVLALIAAHRDVAAAAELHLAAVADQPTPGRMAADNAQHARMAEAVLAERAGDPQQAVAVLAGMLDSAQVEATSERRLWLPHLTRLAVETGDLDVAGAAAAAAAADAHLDPTPSRTAAAEHCGGLLSGDPTRLLAAADGYRGVGRPLILAAVLEDAAVVLAGRGDVSAARAAYAEAVGLYTGLRADYDLQRAESRLRRFGVRRAPGRRRRPATGWGALTATELKTAYLVAEGLSNAEVAARLFLSRRSAEIYVSRILAKLGARSRVEIAREAANHPAGAANRPA